MPHPATLTLEGGTPETHAVSQSARGIRRRRQDVCCFSPLRIELRERPSGQSLLRGQRRMKLVTHCRPPRRFEQMMLLEYAAYRLYNRLTPHSFRVRLATIDYVEPGAASPSITRYGFLIEDVDDAAERNGLVEARVGNRIMSAQLDPQAAGLYSIFQYLIGNLDWALNAGPSGEDCCHNTRLAAASETATSGLVPLPYDFDHSGLVDAPYAAVPQGVPVRSVRTRHYRGFCRHNDMARAAVARVRAARPELLAELQSIGELEAGTRRRAAAFLEQFFDRTSSTARVENMLSDCIGRPMSS